MQSSRNPRRDELNLLELLVSGATDLNLSPTWKEGLLVRSMEDGGMGSFRLMPHGISDENRLYGRTVSEYQFVDDDGVTVLASLNVDEAGELFEVDIWKTDFSPLQHSFSQGSDD